MFEKICLPTWWRIVILIASDFFETGEILTMSYFNICLVLALVLCQSVPAFSEENSKVKLPTKEKFHLFLLVGQSNMAGRGKVEEQDLVPHPRVLSLNKGNEWQPAVDPIHFDKPKYIGVGLGRTFGIEVAEANPKITVGLIPCAVGGSPIASWEPGALDKATGTHPYDDTLARMKIALPMGKLVGILWHQGESDTTPEKAAVYESKLHALIARLRKELDAPDVPFIAGQMGIFAEQPWSDVKKQVDAVHQQLPTKLTATAFVDAKGLNHKGDEIHFDSAAYRELGRRYALAYATLSASP